MPKLLRTAENTLEGRRPRDTSGSTASNRFDYQKNWTLRLLLDRHPLAGEYAIVCDYHEDVVRIEIEQTPGLHFYQVKTRNTGSWTIRRLVSRSGKGGKGRNSIVGKLYQHHLDFGDRVASISMVSNATYSIRLDSGGNAMPRAVFAYSEVHAEERRKVEQSLVEEFGVTIDVVRLAGTAFSVTDQPIASHDDDTVGYLARFLHNAAAAVDAVAAHRALFDEIRRRTNAEGEWTNLDELIRKKGFTRADMNAFLDRIRQTKDVLTCWPAVNVALSLSGLSLKDRTRIKAKWDRYAAERLDEANAPLQHVRDRTVAHVLAAERDGATGIWQQAQQAANQLSNDPVFDRDYVLAIALLEIVACDHAQLQEAHPQSEDTAI
jgi:hypothetical protein